MSLRPRLFPDPFALAGLLLGMFLAIVGAKLCLLRAAGSPLPFFDAWVGEGDGLLRPWMSGTWRWTEDLWEPFYQHRIALTRLFVLGVFEANGQQWDTRVEAAVAIPLHAAGMLGLAAILARRVADRGSAAGRAAGFTGMAGLLCALPFNWENTIAGGFQSQFYFLLGCSILAIWGLATRPIRSAGWWAGVCAGVLAWFSIASGPLAGLAVALWAGARLGLRDGGRRENLTALAAGGALFVGGSCLSLGVPQATKFLPGSVGELLRVGAGFASWPFLSPTLAVAAWLPFLVLVVQRVRLRRLGGRAERFLFPFGLWVLLQAAVLAMARNRAGGLGVSRYMDLLSPGILVNLGCLHLLSRGRPRGGGERTAGPHGPWAAWAGAAWLGAVLAALGVRTSHALRDELPSVRYHNLLERQNAAAFVATGDVRLFERAGYYDFQSQDLPNALEVLSNPVSRRFLPACARAPLGLAAAGAERFALGTRQAAPGSPVPAEPAWVSVASATAAGATFRSQPLTATLPYLEFEVFGPVGTPGAEIFLVSEREPGKRVRLPPGLPEPGEAWRRVVVPAPSSPFRLAARVEGGPEHNLGFSFPREMGPLSAGVEKFLEAGVEILFVGVALWAGGVWWQRSRGRPAARDSRSACRVAPPSGT